MRIEVFSGQPGLERTVNYFFDAAYIFEALICPEKEYEHPKELYETVKNCTLECIRRNQSIYILTYSELVLYAVRVAIKQSGYNDIAKVHQLIRTDEGVTDVCADINSMGRLDNWAKDVFDIYEQAMMELL